MDFIKTGHSRSVHVFYCYLCETLFLPGSTPFYKIRRFVLHALITAVLAVAGQLSVVGAVYASGVSELYRSQALLVLHENDYSKAITLLNKAIKADEEDSNAYYLRGIVFLKLKQGRSALDDLQVAEQAGLGKDKITRQISIARLLYGQQQYKRGHYEQSVETLRHVSSTPKMNASASYWQALALAKLERNQEAIALIEKSLVLYPDSELLPKMEILLKDLRQPAKERKWKVNLNAGLASDSNVGLFPESQPLPENISEQSDYRMQLELEASRNRLAMLGSNNTTIAYRIFQASYTEVSGYNLQSHTLSLDQRWAHAAGDWGANYQFVLADLDSNGKQQSLILSAYHTYAHGSRRLSLSKLSLNNNSYSYVGYEGYGGMSLDGLYRHIFFGDKKNEQYYLGLRLNQSNTVDSLYGSSGLAFDTGLEYPIAQFKLGASYTHEMRQYEGRDDILGQWRLFSLHPINKKTRVEAGIKGTTNDSSSEINKYNRTLVYVIGRWTL